MEAVLGLAEDAVTGSEPLARIVALLDNAPVAADAVGMIDQLRLLEDVKSVAAAKQAEITVAFDLAQRREQAAAGVPADQVGAGVAAQVALARRESPARGGRLLGLARTLTGMPHTLAAFRGGQLNEWRTTLIVRETICLTADDRAGVDEELAADTGTFDGAGDRAIISAVKAAAYRRDPASVARRAAKAVTERTVSLRPAPDTMTYLTALHPVAEGVAAYAALSKEADTRRATGDARSRGQVMADTLVERLTGTPGGITGIELQLIMTDRTLLHAGPEPARIPGYGIVPAATARTLITNPVGTAKPGTSANPNDASAGGLEPELDLWVRRLYTAPGSGDLVAMDSKARLFPPALKRFLHIRDDTCRTPYCDAPIRHHDHITAWHHGGKTTTDNGQGLCEACNHTKETPGWKAKPLPTSTGTGTGTTGGHTVQLRTPTGHAYHSTAPPLPGTAPPLPGTPPGTLPGLGFRAGCSPGAGTPASGKPRGAGPRPVPARPPGPPVLTSTGPTIPTGPLPQRPRPSVQVLGRVAEPTRP
ncbi:HNH endonuclease [Pseudarthrobacter enclensis]|uniref:HNH endonuclease n=1 Tax=Pseudarthrobacter enclensis TaxID=993070 RepID=UPI00081577B3|nr:HNH endonuclease [Pseudarthrobacter enclensis]SCC26673.1 HNH endonuclease [Pseudarthrobacter enclensis]